MTVTRLKRAALALPAAALLGCGEPPLSPAPPPQADLIGSLLQATGLLRCTPMPTATATQTVGSAGGSKRTRPPQPSVPAGAAIAPATHTPTAPADKVEPVRMPPRRPPVPPAAAQ